ncbi:unnamed protein product [Caenorhabditis angaria]|uniref:Tc1-like transposase DDE domain-containing protein n=1 Tax=Caenorhabditis angaria TaxID=860376 RepID=A0A9P1MUM1_9PELO|nr:unnamed protein product [Caenorhabditis angaria]
MSKRIRRSRNVVRRYIQDVDGYGTKKSPGRPRKVSTRDERNILRMVSNSVTSANDVRTELKLDVCKNTVINTIHRSGVMVHQKMAKTPSMTDRHKEFRLDFVRNNLATDWNKVVFSDEKKWNLDGPDGFRSYWRDLRKDPRLFSRRNFGGGSLMIWGAFCGKKKLQLQFISTKMNSNDYQEVLKKTIVPFFRNRRNTHIFQQDNASIHKSRSTLDFLAKNRIKDMKWPACSPDLNPIENIWGFLARRVYKTGVPFKTQQELKDAIIAAWDAIPPSELEKLVDSMKDRMMEVIQKNGGETKY